MVKHIRIARLSRIAVILALVVALCLTCVSPGYAVIAEASIIVPAVIAALAAFGIGTSVSAMQSGDIISWYTQKLEQWALSVGQTVSTLLDVAKITTDPLGMLRLAPSFLLNVKAFAQWLQTNLGISEGGQPVVNAVSSFSDQPIPYDATANRQTMYEQGYRIAQNGSNGLSVVNWRNGLSEYVFVYQSSSNIKLVVCSNQDYASYVVVKKNNSSYTDLASFGGSSVSHNSTYANVWYKDISISGYSYDKFVCPKFSSLNVGLAEVQKIYTGNTSSITLTPDTVLDYPDTTGDDEEDMPYVIDYGGVAGDTVQDAADTVMQKVISNDLVVDGAVETPPQEMEWADIMSPRAVNGLDDIFPFCIPFDVYHFFQAMIATPTAPHFEVPFVVPGLVNYTFVLDFAQFNTVAQIFRTMELLCFCIGLALATRRLIRG